MKIKGQTRRQLLDVFKRGQITEDAAEKMADLLIAEGVEDTNDISFSRWIELTDKATGAPPRVAAPSPLPEVTYESVI